MPKEDGYFKPGADARREGTMWKPGCPSPNPSGISAYRHQYNEAFHLYLMGEIGPEEAGQILVAAARAREQWAVIELLRRVAPVENTLKLRHESANHDNQINWSKMTDAEFDTVSKIFERIEGESRLLEGGEGPKELA